MLVEQKEFLEKDGSIGYIETIINSGNILKTIYFPKVEKMYIAFSRGQIYSYENISNEFYYDFVHAKSQGEFFHKKINKNKEYPYRREFTLNPSEIKEINEIIENKLSEDEQD